MRFLIGQITYEIFMTFEGALRSSSCPSLSPSLWKVLYNHANQFLEQNLDHGLGVYAEQVTTNRTSHVAHAKLKPTIFSFSTLKRLPKE